MSLCDWSSVVCSSDLAITSTAVTGTITTTGSLSAVAGADTAGAGGRSEERRVGEEWKTGRTLHAEKEKRRGTEVEAGGNGAGRVVVTMHKHTGTSSVD